MNSAIALFLLLPCLNVWAWGPIGHRVVAKLAESELSSDNLKKINELLAGESLAMVSTWADEIRSDKDHAHTGTWHYINIQSEKKIEAKNFEGKGYQVLEEQMTILKNSNAPKEKRAQALKWIVHLVGDLHQPLHAGLASDRGGNSVSLRWFGKNSNLHELWDSGLIDARKLSYSELAEFLARKITPTHRTKASDPALKWIEEDVALRELVYSIPKKQKGRKGKRSKWEYDYVYRTKEVLDNQLIKAGLRLAHILESSLTADKKPKK